MATNIIALEKGIENYKYLFDGLVEQSVAGVYLLQDGVLTYVNETFARMCGTQREKLQGKPLSAIAPSEQRVALQEQYERRLRGDDPASRFIVRVTPRTGAMRLIEIHGTRISFLGGYAVVGVGIDITEREQKEQELRQSEQRLTALLSHVGTAIEDERLRISMELHDAIGGMLTATKFDVSRAQRYIQQLMADTVSPELQAQEKKIGETLLGVTQLIQETISAVRQISEGLRPSVLQHFGITAAIANDLKQFQTRYNIACTFNDPVLPFVLDGGMASDLYRIFQEAMTNIAKHASATQVTVCLNVSDGEMILEITDNGCGIPDAMLATTKGYGVLGMKERARRHGGELSIESPVGAGSQVSVRLPVPANT